MQEIVDVQIGQIKAGKGKILLRSTAIGSCVAIAAYDGTKKIGALAHIMLPGRAPENKEPEEKTKYAGDAIEAMISQMAELGSKKDNIEVVLAGGANVLEREDDTICKETTGRSISFYCRAHAGTGIMNGRELKPDNHGHY